MTSAQLSSPNNYDIMEVLGSGTYGTVVKIKIKETDEIFAVKEIQLKNCDDDKEKEALHNDTVAEYNLLTKKLRNVVRSIGYNYDKESEKIIFSMNYYPNNLKTYVQAKYSDENNAFDFFDFLTIFKDILTGLHSLIKDAKSIHRDLKPENVLIDSKGRALIGDLGVAKNFDNTIHANKLQTIFTIVGTSTWMAPEMAKMQTNPNQEKVTNLSRLDIFSLGMIAAYMIDFKAFAKYKKGFNVKEELVDKFLSEYVKCKVPKCFYYILRSMLSYHSVTRPSITELYDDIVRKNIFSQSSDFEPMRRTFDYIPLGRTISDEAINEINIKRILNSEEFTSDYCEQLGMRLWDDDTYLRIAKISQSPLIDVWRLQHKGQKTYVQEKVLKFSNYPSLEEKMKIFMRLLREKKILEKIKTKKKQYFPEFRGVFYTLDSDDQIKDFIIVTETGDFTLKELLHTRKNIKEKKGLVSPFYPSEALNIIYHISKALNFMHKQNISHNNINLENIVLSKKRNTYFLIDFGRSFIFDKTNSDSSNFTEEELNDLPEFYDEDETSLNPFKADVYSLGLCLKLMIEGFKGTHECTEILSKMISRDWEIVEEPKTFFKRIKKLGFKKKFDFLEIEKEIIGILEERRTSQEGYQESFAKNNLLEMKIEKPEDVLRELKEYEETQMKMPMETELKHYKEVLWRLALAYEKNKEFTRARECFEQILTLQNSKPCLQSKEEISRTYFKIAKQHRELKEYYKSLELLNQSIILLKNSYKTEENPDIILIKIEIADLWSFLRDHDKALDILQFVLKAQTRIYRNEENHNIVHTLKLISHQYKNLEKFDQALEYHQKAIDIETKIHGGENHIDIANSIIYKGIMLNHLKRSNEAKVNFERALEIQKRINGTEVDLAIASTIAHIGISLSNKGEHSKALDTFTKCLNIRLKCLGNEEHSLISSAYRKIAEELFFIGDFNKALEISKKCLEINKKIGKTDLQTKIENIFCLKKISEIHMKSGNLDLALSEIENIFKIELNNDKNKILDIIAPIYEMKAVILRKKGNFKEAQMLYKHTFELYSEYLDEDDSKLINLREIIRELNE